MWTTEVISTGEDDYRMSITGAVYSKLGTEIVASYSDEDVYVFDVDLHQLPCNSDDSPSGSFLEDSRKRKFGAADLLDDTLCCKPKRFSGHRNCQTGKLMLLDELKFFRHYAITSGLLLALSSLEILKFQK